MWRKNSIDERAKYYLQLQKEREVREEREKQELERRRKEEDQLIAQETEKRDKIRQANLEEQLRVRGWCSMTDKEGKNN
jgi:uncharacterized protein (DUF2344 family)